MMKDVAPEYGGIAQSLAPVGLMMAVFTLAYSLWFGFAWGLTGWLVFLVIAAYSLYIFWVSLKNVKHSRQFEVHQTPQGERIGRQMGILSAVSYTSIWVLAALLFFLGQGKFIFPMLTFIIGLHFIPQAKIMNRKIDYLTAPFPLISASVAFYPAYSNLNWLTLAAIAGIGGAVATSIYGFYILYIYRKIAEDYQIPYP